MMSEEQQMPEYKQGDNAPHRRAARSERRRTSGRRLSCKGSEQ